MRSKFCAGPVRRREFLAAGVLGGLTLPDLLRMRAVAEQSGQSVDSQTNVIFVWLPGGPPHLDMYDMKPKISSDYRGAFHPIPTNVPGIDVCELMPRHTKIADRFSVIRSVAHTFADHGGGHKRMMTGRIPATPVETVNDAPATGSIVSKCRERGTNGLPNYVSLNPGGRINDVFAQGAAYLGQGYLPFNVEGDPTQPNFVVPNIGLEKTVAPRVDDRMKLLGNLDRIERQIDATRVMESMDQYQQRAVSLLLSDKAKKAFDLSQESDALRDRYGRHCWGQRALMARRLVEAGVSFVTVVMENPYQSGVPWLKQGVY
ncbi:MAG: DUF1501 domain-containing protein, partial [Planctomycetes bacterium]|nr:DUF1501 domain-containing protein [Planctomycetota bacterium]